MKTFNLVDFCYKDSGTEMSVRLTKYVGSRIHYTVAWMNTASEIGLESEWFDDEGLALERANRLVASLKADICSILSDL